MFVIIYSVNIKPPRHRFGFSLAWGWQYNNYSYNQVDNFSNIDDFFNPKTQLEADLGNDNKTTKMCMQE